MQSFWPRGVILGLLSGIVGVLVTLVPFGSDLEENVGLDLLFRLRGTRNAPPEVVIVSIDKASADRLNLADDPRKWPRSLHARLTDRLTGRGASVIAFDLFFEESRSPGDDSLFAESIGRSRNVVLCQRLKAHTVRLAGRDGAAAGELRISRVVAPLPSLADFAAASAPYPLPKVPVKVSQDWTFKTGAGDTPTLPVVAFQLHALPVYPDFVRLMEKASPGLAARLPKDPDAVLAGRSVVPLVTLLRGIFAADRTLADRMLQELDDEDVRGADSGRRRTLRSLVRMYQGENSKYLNFYGPPRTIATVPYHEALGSPDEAKGGELRRDLAGKAVFVGSSELLQPEQRDGFLTVFSDPNGLDLSGIEIAATSFANLHEDLPVRPLALRSAIGTVFLWGALVGVVCGVFPTLLSAVMLFVLCTAYLLFAKYRFLTGGVWYPVVLPAFLQTTLAFVGGAAWTHVDMSRERRRVRKAFGHYLPDEVVDQVSRNISGLNIGSRLVYGICLETDAEQYTGLSESMDPKELGRFMNRYYEAVFDPVKRHGGIVSNVVGDSMLAIWVGTDLDVRLREKACLAALDIASSISDFNRSCGKAALPTRIGLHSGHLAIGNLGAIDHFEYRPVGDIVNSTTRIEGLNKYLDTRILVSGDVIRQIDRFLAREVGDFLFVGKTRSMSVHELVSPLSEATARQRRACETFGRALEAFRGRSWDRAAAAFTETIDILGEDGPSHFYLKLCTHHRKTPPAEPWSGVVTMDKK